MLLVYLEATNRIISSYIFRREKSFMNKNTFQSLKVFNYDNFLPSYRHPTHRTSIQVLLTAAVSSSLTLQDGTTICLHTVIFKLSMSFVPSNVLSIVVSILQINAKKILRPSCIAIVPIEPSFIPLSLGYRP